MRILIILSTLLLVGCNRTSHDANGKEVPFISIYQQIDADICALNDTEKANGEKMDKIIELLERQQ